jgi:hypothetical protein
LALPVQLNRFVNFHDILIPNLLASFSKENRDFGMLMSALGATEEPIVKLPTILIAPAQL